MEQRKLSPAAARVNAGIKQKNAADSLGVTTATLQNWEKGKTSPPIGKAQKNGDAVQGPAGRDFFYLKTLF